MKEKSTEPGIVWKKLRQWHWLPTTVFFVGIFSIILLLWVNQISERQHVDSLIIDAIMDIEINVALAHLRLEEAIGGDTTADVKEIIKYIDEAIKLNDSTLNGGESEHGRITEPLHDPDLRAHGESIRQNLVKFRTLALESLQDPEKSKLGSVANQQFDTVFKRVLGDVGAIDDFIGKNRTINWEKYRRLFIWILLILIFSITAATAGIWSYEKRREKAAGKLRESEKNLKLYQALINQSNDSIEVLDPETGNFLKVNKKACADLGYSREELLSMKVFDIDPSVKPSDFSRIMEDLRRAGAGIWTGVHLRKDGSTFPVEVSLTIVQFDRSYLVAVARDITERKQSEEALRESEGLYTDLFNGMLEGFAFHKIICDEKGNPVDYRFLKINPAFERLTGLRAADLIGKTVLEVMPETEPYWIDTYGRVALTGESINFENYSRELKRHFKVTAYSPRREQFVAIFEDITERKQAQNELASYSRELTSLNMASDTLMLITNLRDIYEEICNIIYTVFDLKMIWLGLIGEGSFEIKPVAHAGFEDGYLSAGRFTWDDSPTGMGPAGTAVKGKTIYKHNINDPLFAPWKSEAQKRGYVDIMSVPLIYARDKCLGVLTFYSDSPNYFTPDRVRLCQIFSNQAAIAIENVRLIEELEGKVKERTRKLEEANLDLHTVNLELVLRREEAEYSSRSKTDFLANMSHELRTPLNAIMGFSDIMQQGMAGPVTDKQKEFLNDISESGQHLLTMITDILDLSKVESGKLKLEPGTISLKEIFENSLGMFKEKILKHAIEVTTQIDDTITSIIADQRKLKQIIVNLLSNAFKFTPDGGSVQITARRIGSSEGWGNFSETSERPRFPTDGDLIEISVSDTGIGISKENQQRLFQPFQQIETSLTRKYAGTGLGLSLCRRLIELHGGRICVESEEGKGSRFIFVIPVKQ